MPQFYKQVLSLEAFQGHWLKPSDKGIMWGGFALCIILFICRMGIRVSCFGRAFVEDYLMLAALVLFLASIIVCQVLLPYVYQMEEDYWSTEMTSTPLDTAVKAAAGLSSMMYINYVSIWLVKLNFMLFFRRLGNHVVKYRVAWWAVLLYNFLAGAGCIALVAVACYGLPSLHAEGDTCGFFSLNGRDNISTTFIVVLDATGDTLIMAFPIWILWGTKVSMQRKLALSVIFGLVSLTIAVTCIRGTEIGGVNGNYVSILPFCFWLGFEFLAAFTVGCLISFRSLFTYREKAARELHERKCRKAAQQPAPKEPRGLRARARHLQQELLTTFTEWEDTRKVGEGGRFLNSYCPPSGRLSIDFQQDNAGREAAASPSRYSASI
ncbi:hypothetical protein PG984_009072 [Apiospora sp. TS-2023a]